MDWDPPKICFELPFFGRPVMWYGVFFVTGFILGYLLIIPLLRSFFLEKGRSDVKHLSVDVADRLLRYILLGTLIGARLGHVFFYEWPYYKAHLFDIVKIWEGGLASHGGAIGILIALLLFIRKTEGIKFVELLDLVTIPIALACGFIRIGNFVNQEIIGVPTTLPWGVTFLHPADGGPIVPRHPTQLYEAIAYFGTFFILINLWRKGKQREGLISGLFFLLAFSARILVESVKAPLSSMRDESFLMTGQLLSFPFLLIGIYLIYPKKFNKFKLN
jgi:prolipoprotein diacylglyceryl transferase